MLRDTYAWQRKTREDLGGPPFNIFLALMSSLSYIITDMSYEVQIKRRVERGLRKLPSDVQKILYLLIADLRSDGPIRKGWRNFSPLGHDRFHCHLNYRYVACWTCRKNEIVIEVYYVGSREKAPY